MPRILLGPVLALLVVGPLSAQQPPPADAPSRPVIALQGGQSGQVSCVEFSPDGKTLATGGTDGAVLWDLATREPRASLPAAMRVIALAFSPDGATLATTGTPSLAALWDVATGRLRATLEGCPQYLRAVSLSPDSAIVAFAALNDGLLRLWAGRTGQPLCVLEHPGAVVDWAFSADSKRLGVCYTEPGADGGVGLWVWDIASKRVLSRSGAKPRGASVTALSPDHRRLAAGGKDCPPSLWDLTSSSLVKTLADKPAAAFAFSPDGRLLAMAGYEGDLHLLDGLTGVHLGAARALLTPQNPGGMQLLFSPDGSILAERCFPWTVRLWDVDPRHPGLAQSSALEIGQPMSIAFSPDAKTLATAGFDPRPRLWDPHSGKLLAALAGEQIATFRAWVSPDGKTAATGNLDGRVRRWDLQTGQLLAALPGPDGRALAGVFSHDGSLLATSYGRCAFEGDQIVQHGRGVRLWSMRTNQIAVALEDVPEWICPSRMCFSPDDLTLEAVSVSRKVYQWDVATGKLKTPSPEHASWVRDNWGEPLSPDGKMLGRMGPGPGSARILDAATETVQATLEFGEAYVSHLAFSGDGKVFAGLSDPGKAELWDVATHLSIPVTRDTDLMAFGPEVAHPIDPAGSGFRVYDPVTGRELAIVLAVPQPAQDASAARPIEAGAKAVAAAPDEWFVSTPEGYFDCSAGAAKYVRWNVNGRLYPAERYMRRFRRPDLVRKALAGERLTEKPMTLGDIPPAAGFVGLHDGDAAPDNALTFAIEARDDHDIKDVELLINGRPPTPDEAKPIEVGAKPIELGAKTIELGAKADDPSYRVAKRFTFRVSLPKGVQEIRVRAVAYDDTDLGSDPVEVVLKRAAAQEVVGDLYVLSVGVSKYANSAAQGFRDLRYPAADACAIADRFQQEGKPLYGEVHARTLTDDQATLASIREGLQWLTTSVRPGQIDTAVIFLSGHGVSDNGRYFFAPYDLDRKALDKSALSGQELREALGGKLRARAVFLFVDACHAGGLSGRSDDLALELGDGVFLMASCGSRDYSYESADWGHGAFTYALLQALGRKELARDGVIYFNALAYAVPDGVADLMTKAGRNESEEEPCIPLAARRLRVPLAHVPG